jgi:hypothetical protein
MPRPALAASGWHSYHAGRWHSNRIRREAFTEGDPAHYGRAPTRCRGELLLPRQRPRGGPPAWCTRGARRSRRHMNPPPRIALAAAEGPLLTRVQRVLGQPWYDAGPGAAWLGALVLALALAGTMPPALASPDPGGITQAADGDVQVASSDGVSNGVSDAVSDSVPGGLPAGTPGAVSGGVRGGMAGGIPSGVPGGLPGGALGGVSGGVRGGVAGGIPGGVQRGAPGELRGGMTATDAPANVGEGTSRASAEPRWHRRPRSWRSSRYARRMARAARPPSCPLPSSTR